MSASNSFSPLARSNVNSWWGAFTARVLVRLGVRDVVICPGSRSTPLTYAFAQARSLRAVPVLDERSAAFFALGLAKTAGRPVVLVCTSGTAAANFYPAVVEAAESGVPLVVLTADRPPELRYHHAGQTIDQLKLYGDFVRFFADAPVPELTNNHFLSWRDTLRHAVDRAIHAAGPVHLNCPFREPLPPQEGLELDPAFSPEALAEAVREIPAHIVPEAPAMCAGRKTLLIIGPGVASDEAAPWLKIAREAHWVVITDGLSDSRFSAPGVGGKGGYEVFLRHEGMNSDLMPDQVIQLGDLPTSKALRAWLQRAQVTTVQVDRLAVARNAALAPVQRVASPRDGGVDTVAAQDVIDWRQLWEARFDQTRAALGEALDAETVLREPEVTRVLARVLPTATPIFVASSMPVRDWELWAEGDGQGFQMVVNRGANGIDGTLSTALGMAQAAGRPGILYTGDLALLHDTNGFLLASSGHWRGSLTIVCINNGGGGIFGHLPIAARHEVFEDFFATPQQVDLGRLTAAYGIAHERITTKEQLAATLPALPASGVRFLEVITDRTGDATWRKTTYARIAADCSS